jgi:hypothetical protein
MRLTRQRTVIAVCVALFLAAFFAIGAVSRTSPAAAPASGGTGGVPSSLWYWTMAVSPADPNVLVVGSTSGLYRSEDGSRRPQPTGPNQRDERPSQGRPTRGRPPGASRARS